MWRAGSGYVQLTAPVPSSRAGGLLPALLYSPPQDWLHYLLAGLNFPHLLSRIALLPRASSKTAAGGPAAVLAAAAGTAERRLQQQQGLYMLSCH